MNNDINYIKQPYTSDELNKMFIKEFARVRRENNLSQSLLARYSNVDRVKVARIENGMNSPSVSSLLDILAPIGYTIKIVKVKQLNENKEAN